VENLRKQLLHSFSLAFAHYVLKVKMLAGALIFPEKSRSIYFCWSFKLFSGKAEDEKDYIKISLTQPKCFPGE
jgi:hypothetical protein